MAKAKFQRRLKVASGVATAKSFMLTLSAAWVFGVVFRRCRAMFGREQYTRRAADLLALLSGSRAMQVAPTIGPGRGASTSPT